MSATSADPVVITGVGVVSPAGPTLADTMDRVLAAKATAGPVTHFVADDLPVRIACEVADLDVDGRIGRARRAASTAAGTWP